MTKALILRTCNEDMTSYRGYKWPESGYVECPDWDEKPECGNGLHGLLWGEGDGNLLDWEISAKWLVVEIDKWVDLDGKVKFPNGNVVHVGNQKSATNYIYNNGGQGKVIVGLHITPDPCCTRIMAGFRGIVMAENNFNAKVTVGDEGEATVGYAGTATAGVWGKATAGRWGKAMVGNYGIAKVGDNGEAVGEHGSKAIAGHYGIATVGEGGKATVGNCGRAISKYNGMSEAGDDGIAIAGYRGTAVVGKHGIATVGQDGKAKAGENGSIQIQYWWDGNFRTAIGYVGESGIEPNVFYIVRKGKLVKEEAR